uniref:SDO1-like protein C21C3.19 n=1 Tax=Anthurium amnicola TaxID=1678845 RepID=A0A1D1ZBD3_9ARAE
MAAQDETRVIYKPKNSREEFFVFVYPEEVMKWRKDKSIPLTEVVQTFDVFENARGSEGKSGRPSKQTLENTFNTSNDTEIINHILEHGVIHNTRKGTKEYNATNESRGKGVSTSESAIGIHN